MDKHYLYLIILLFFNLPIIRSDETGIREEKLFTMIMKLNEINEFIKRLRLNDAKG